MNPIEQAFIKATVKEQEEFVINRHRVLCLIICNKVELSWCGRVIRLLKEKMAKTKEQIHKDENK